MRDSEMETTETKEERIARLEAYKRDVDSELQKLRGGPSSPTDISSKHTAEAEAKSLFDRMTPAELMELYQTDHEKWEKVMESVESAGLRKLRDVSYPLMG
jgi:hypothetical protein